MSSLVKHWVNNYLAAAVYSEVMLCLPNIITLAKARITITVTVSYITADKLSRCQPSHLLNGEHKV